MHLTDAWAYISFIRWQHIQQKKIELKNQRQTNKAVSINQTANHAKLYQTQTAAHQLKKSKNQKNAGETKMN